MGKNKHTRKLIVGQMRTVRIHEDKILAEMEKSAPNLEWVRKWEKEIDNARKRVRDLEKRLER